MKWLLCWLRGHVWQPPIPVTEYWYAYEDIGPTGGWRMEYAQSATPVKDGWTEEYKSRRCASCGKVEKIT